MSDLRLGRNGKQGSVNTDSIKAGIKKEQIKEEKLQNIFDTIDGSVDGKKDGIIDAEEMKQFKKQLMEAAGKDTLSAREAGKFLKKAGIKNLDNKELFEFLDVLSQSAENIEQSTVETKNGQKFIHIKYKDGTIETINPDKSAQVATFAEGGGGILKYDSKRKLTEEIVENGEGKKAVTTFDGNEKAVETIITDANNAGLTQTITYNENEEPETLKIENGSTTENYTYTEEGVVLTSRTENKGIPAKETTTNFTYNDDGSVTENITEYNRETTRITKDDKLISEIVNEKTQNGGIKHTETISTDTGHEVTVQDGENVTKTIYNQENHALSQTKVVNGQEYSIEYDGKGNTKVILQNGESIEALAKKFGCTKQELLDANGGKIRGWAGDDVVVPGELEADNKRLQGRQTKEEAIEAYKKVAAEIQAVKDEVAARKPIDFTNKDYDTYEQLAEALFKREGIENPSKRRLKARIDDLKKTNPDIKDGELKGKRITANVSEAMHGRISDKEQSAKEYDKTLQTREEANSIAQKFYQIADDNAGINSMKKMQKLLDEEVTPDNILHVLDAYDKYKEGDSSIIDTVTSEVGAGGTKAQRDVLNTIMDKLAQAAENAGVSAGDIEKAKTDFTSSLDKEFNAALRRTNPKDMEKAIDFLRGAIVAKQTGNVQDMTDADAITAFNADFAATDAEAQKSYKDAREAEGWTARAGDTVLGWFGCTTIEDMDAKLGKNAEDVKRLAAAAGDETEFKKVYKEVFGVEFDKNKIAARDTALGNYQQAQNLSSAINITSGLLEKSGTMDYSALRSEIKDKFQFDDATIDAAIENYAGLLNKDISSDAGKKEVLVRFLEETSNQLTAEYREVTKGKSIEQMGKDLDLLTKSAFGTNDIVKDVIQFNENQQTTEMVTEAAFEIAGTIALQFIPGLGQVAAARLAVSAARWGTKAVKVANYAEKAFAATKNLQNMNKATRIGTQMVNAGAATMAVDLSNGKSVREATEKALMNMSFAGVGAGSSILAPKLMQTFGITNRALANEIAEEIMNAAGSYGITKLSGGEYGSQDAFIDFASGLIMSRISHVKTPAAKSAADTPETPATQPQDTKPKNDPPKTPKATPENAPSLDIASSNGNATPSSVRVGDKKAAQIRENVNKAVSNPDISGEDLAQLRQEAGGIQNRDVRREVQQKVDNAAENLSPEEQAAFDAANRANAQKNVDHIFEKHSELNSADTRVMNEYINNTDDASVLRELKKKLNEKEHTNGGVTANYDRLRKAIDDKIAALEPAPVKTNTQQHDDVVAMLNEKAQTGKGLSENDFTQLKEYLATMNDEAQLKELKGLLGGKKMTSAQKKQLKEALAAKTEELKNTPAPVKEAELVKDTPASNPAEAPATPPQNEQRHIWGEVSDDNVEATPELVKQADTPAAAEVIVEEIEVRYPTPEEKMAMGQIGNNIGRAKSLDNLDKAQAWLDKMPDCDQKSRLQAQLNEKRTKITPQADVNPEQVQESQNAGKPQNQAEIHRQQHLEAQKAKIKELENKYEAVTTTHTINGKQTPVKVYKNSQQGSNTGYWMQNLETGKLSYVKYPPRGRLGIERTTLYYKDTYGNQITVKIDDQEIANIERELYGEGAQAKSEALAADLYRAAGINAPEIELISDSVGNTGTSSKFMDNLETPDAKDIANIRKGFAADCWLANWDALKDGNIMTQNGQPIRTDVGGSLCYRARGARKGTAFGENVNELTSFFSGKSLSRKYLEGMSRDELIDSLKTVTTIDDKTIISLVEKAKANGISNPEFLKEMLIERRNYMKRFQTLCEANPQKQGENIADYVARIQKATPKTTYNIGGRSFEEIPVSSRIYGNLTDRDAVELEHINKHISIAEHLTPSQKRIFEASYEALQNSKGRQIHHNATDVLTQDNLLHATSPQNIESILQGGLVSREYSGQVGAGRSDGDPGSMTPMCADLWDVQDNYSIKDFFSTNRRWNKGEANFMPNPFERRGTVVIVFDKKSVAPALIDNSFSVSKQDSELYKDGNMSGHRSYTTHRAVPVGLPSNAIDRIIVPTDIYGKSYVDRLQKQIKKSGLDIKIYDTQGTLLYNPVKPRQWFNFEFLDLDNQSAVDTPVRQQQSAPVNEALENAKQKIIRQTNIPVLQQYISEIDSVYNFKYFIHAIKTRKNKDISYLTLLQSPQDKAIFNDMVNIAAKNRDFNPIDSIKFYVKNKKDSGIINRYKDMIELVKDGTIDSGVLNSYANSSIDKRMARDTELLIKTKRENLTAEQVKDLYIPHIDDGKITIDKIKNIPDGNAFESNGKLYLKTSEQSVTKLNISKDTYFKLFPPGYNVKQRAAGKCYLYSKIISMLDNPQAKAKLLNNCFSETNSVLKVNMPDSKISLNVDLNDIESSLNKTPYYSKGCSGVNLLEQAYEKNEVYIKSQIMIDYLEKNINNPNIDRNKAMAVLEDLINNPADPHYVLANEKVLNGHSKDFSLDDILTIEEAQNSRFTSTSMANPADLKTGELFYGVAEGNSGYASNILKLGNNPLVPPQLKGKTLLLKNPKDNSIILKDEILTRLKGCIINASTPSQAGSAVESVIDADYGILTSHNYSCIITTMPDGKTGIKVINPHNSAAPIILNFDQFRKYFMGITINTVY